MEIRLLTVDDLEAYWKLRYAVLRDSPEAFHTSADEYVERPMEESARLLREATGASNAIVGAFDGGELVGMASCSRQSPGKLRHKAYVAGVAVASHARGRGVGRLLMQEAIARARGWPGVEQVHLTVTASNERARGLYLSLGFTTYGLEPRALKIGDRYFDEELMVLFL